MPSHLNPGDAPAPTDEPTIAALVVRFYEQARAHPRLGPLFARHVHDWPRHEQVVHDFWSRVLNGTERYRGHPYPMHLNLGIQREHFEDWLGLFRATAQELLPPAAAARAIAKAEHMSEAFRAGLFPFDKPVAPPLR